MAISYSISEKKSNFSRERRDGKLYATAQNNGVEKEMEFAREKFIYYIRYKRERI